jgi:hypothetical protein
MKNTIKNAEKRTGKQVYYVLRCDATDLPKGINSDMSVDLCDIKKLSKILRKLESKNIAYDLAIQQFTESTSGIQEFDIVSLNYKN